jgi:hypothetical protein
MTPTVRKIVAVIAGLAVAFLVIVVVEMICHAIYPLPQDVNPLDPQSLKSAMAGMPVGALVGVVLAWILGALAGSFTAAKIAGSGGLLPGLGVGIFLLLASVLNMAVLPHPVWVWAAALILIPTASVLGTRLAGRPAA